MRYFEYQTPHASLPSSWILASAPLPALQVHQPSFGFTFQPLQLGPSSSDVSLVSSPATSLETPRCLCYQRYPCQRHSITGPLAVCPLVGVLTVCSIACVLAIHSFISVPAGTQHVETYHRTHILSVSSPALGLQHVNREDKEIGLGSWVQIHTFWLQPCYAPYIGFVSLPVPLHIYPLPLPAEKSPWLVDTILYTHSKNFLSLTILFCFLPSLYFFQHSPFHSPFSVYPSVVSPALPVSATCTSVDDFQIFLILAYSLSLSWFQIFLNIFSYK